jgi:recombination associated protein RdgC
MFRNVRFFRLTSAWPESEQELSEALSVASFKPCGPLTEKISGWEPPGADATGSLGRRLDGADLLQLRSQSRLLPAAAINEALDERIEEFRNRMGQDPGYREKRRLKEQTRDSLLPKALLRSERTKGFLFLAEKILVVDASTPAKAERFLAHLQTPLGKVDTTALTFKRSLSGLLTRIFLEDGPGGITLGRECRMQDASENRSRVHWVDMDLTDASIRRHVREGMKLTHLAIEVGGVMSCVIDENGSLSKLRLIGMDANEEIEDEDPQARLDAEFVLLTGMLRQLIDVLARSLGGIETENSSRLE